MTGLTRQYGALPFRRGSDGRIEIALVTSRTRRRWIIPKGWPQPEEAHLAAAREALEEAGLVGTVAQKAIGAYRYDKIRADGAAVACEVDVHLLAVERELDHWPEREHRLRRWVRAAAVADELDEAGLSTLLRGTDWLSAAKDMCEGNLRSPPRTP